MHVKFGKIWTKLENPLKMGGSNFNKTAKIDQNGVPGLQIRNGLNLGGITQHTRRYGIEKTKGSKDAKRGYIQI